MTIAQMGDICHARNGERCKDRICHKACDRFRREHKGLKPMEFDPVKTTILKAKETMRNGNWKEEN